MDYHVRWLLEAIKRDEKYKIYEVATGASSMGQGDVLFYSARVFKVKGVHSNIIIKSIGH